MANESLSLTYANRVHAPDSGFADFVRGSCDGAHIDWDIAPVPTEGGLPAGRVVVSRPPQVEPATTGREGLLPRKEVVDREGGLLRR